MLSAGVNALHDEDKAAIFIGLNALSLDNGPYEEQVSIMTEEKTLIAKMICVIAALLSVQ